MIVKEVTRVTILAQQYSVKGAPRFHVQDSGAGQSGFSSDVHGRAGLVSPGYGDEDFAALLVMQADSAGVTLVSEDVPAPDGLEPNRPGRTGSGGIP